MTDPLSSGTDRHQTTDEMTEREIHEHDPCPPESRCAICWPEDEEPPEPDGECYRGGEAASALAEEQASIQRNLK